MRRNHKKSPVPGGYVRRTGPATCSVGVMPGMHVQDLMRLRLTGQLYAAEVPYGVDVSWALWAEFIRRNHQWQPVERYCISGDCLMPDDAVAFLDAMADEFPIPSVHKQVARTY